MPIAETTAPIRLQADAAMRDIEAAADGSKSKRFEMTAYTGAPLRLNGWPHPVVIDIAGIANTDKPRPIYLGHSEDIDDLLGQTTRIETRDGKLVAEGSIIGRSDRALRVIQLAQDGFKWQASIGAVADRAEFIQAGGTVKVNGQTHTGPLHLVHEATLHEISFVPAGSDSNTTAQIMAQIAASTNRSNNTMPAEPELTSTIDTAREDRAKHYDHLASIEAAAASHPKICAQAIRENWDLDKTKLAVLQANRPAAEPPNLNLGAGAFDEDHGQILAAAVTQLAGYRNVNRAFDERVNQQAADLRCHSAMDLVQAALRLEGQSIPISRDQMIKAAFSNTSLPVALGASGEKVALDSFQNSPATWRLVARAMPARNFREHNVIRPLAKNSSLEPVGPGGEIKHMTVGEETYTFQIDTQAKTATITRQQLINDDLGAFTQVFANFGTLASLRISELVWKAIMGNAGSFFSAGNGNLITGAGSAFGVDAYANMVAALRNQVSGDGQPINLGPHALAVPTSLEAEARSLLTSTAMAVDGNTAPVTEPTSNPWRGSAQLAVEPRLNNANYVGNSDIAYFLFADPQTAPAVIVGFLDGQEGPTVETLEPEPDVLGRVVRVYLDTGVALADPRGAVKADGE